MQLHRGLDPLARDTLRRLAPELDAELSVAGIRTKPKWRGEKIPRHSKTNVVDIYCDGAGLGQSALLV